MKKRKITIQKDWYKLGNEKTGKFPPDLSFDIYFKWNGVPIYKIDFGVPIALDEKIILKIPMVIE